MFIRQPVCETEIVPSLHSNRGGEASATGAGVGTGAAACGGAAFCAAGFCDQAQPAHDSKINRAGPIRIAALPKSRPRKADAEESWQRQPYNGEA
jgi:hypothetical protein